MRYYKHLYLMEGLEKKKDRIIRKLEENKFQVNIHIITLSQNEKNHLEIYNSVLLLQPGLSPMRTSLWWGSQKDMKMR